MNEYLAAAIEERQQAFAANADADESDGTRVFLLKRLLNSSFFEPIGEIKNYYSVKFNSYREQMQFEFATENTTFNDFFAQTSHIGYGVPDMQNEIDIFSIQARDKIPPNGTSPTYKCFGVRADNERFQVPFIAVPIIDTIVI